MTPRRHRHSIQRPTSLAAPQGARPGSVLLVMLSLLLLLMVLGFTALTFTAQEHESANYYADASQRQGVEVNSDVLFDYGLEQLLIGPREENMQSVLWPGRHSLIPNMLGMFGAMPDGSGRTAPLDLQPFNGVGVNLVADNLGQPVVIDPTSGQPLANAIQANLWLSSNLSPAALRDTNVTRAGLIANLPSSDVDYTYPDINNVFLAYNESVSVNPGDPTRVYSVIIPSFHRPQYLRNPQSAGDRVDADWDRNENLATRVMRPHPAHQVVVYGGNQKPLYPTVKDKFPNGVPRFQQDVAGIMTLDQATSLRDPNNNNRPREQGIWSIKPGPSNAGVDLNNQLLENYEYDVDNRGSGKRDGVWLDLGHPPFFLKDGRGVVPLFSFTVLPADGLINVNTAGNLNQLITGQMTTSKASLFGSAYPAPPSSISRSNYGRSAAEINPFWALSADPTSTTYLSSPVSSASTAKPVLQHIAFQKYNPTSQYLINRSEMANLELMFLQWGRPDFDVSNPTLIGTGNVPIGKIIEGRNGETSTTVSGWNNSNADTPNRWSLFPRPGQPVPSGANLNQATQTGAGGAITGIQGDDNYNGFAGWAVDGANQPISLDQHPGVAAREITPPAYVSALNRRYPLGTGPSAGWSTGHPVDLVGAGNYLTTLPNDTGLTTFLRVDPYGTLSPVRWPRYELFQGGSQLQKRSVADMSTTMVPNVNLLGLLDEPAEMIVDRRYRFPGLDSPYPVDELFALHASPGDYAAASSGSRLRSVVPFNFEINQQAQAIRRKFTTDSWDLLNHSFHYDPQRTWEWVQAQFPVGNPIGGYLSFPPTLPQGTNPLFRNEVAAWIGMTMPAPGAVPANWAQFEQFRNNPFFAGLNQQRRLDINRVAWLMNSSQPPQRAVNAASTPAGFLNNTVRFRRLTPHLTDAGSGLLPSAPGSQPPLIAPADQEWWALADRQLLARDIYTLLYLFGSDAAVGSPLQSDIYLPWQKLEMAQFAVNLVDAMDPDDVITEFRFDPNLANGWDLTVDNSLPADGGSVPAVVYGVELQSLTISEVLCIYQAKTPSNEDHSATAYDDGASNRWFTHIELRNASPYPVDLSRGNWRLSVVRQGDTDTRLATPRRPTTQLRTSVVLRRNLRNSPDQDPTLVRGGGILTVGSMGRDDGQVDSFNDNNGNPVVRSADLRVDADDTLDDTYYRLSPMLRETSVPNKTTDAPPGCYVDLIHNSHYGKGYWQLIDYSSGTQDVSNNPQFRGGFLRGSETAGPNTLDPANRIKIILERRVHLGRTSPTTIDPQYDATNPWITVDEFTVQPQILQIDGGNSQISQTELRTRLFKITSTERNVPCVRDEVANSDGPIDYPSAIHPAVIRNQGQGLVRNTFALNNLGQQTINPNRYQSITTNKVWQPHYDRDFNSVMDLLGIPLYGPHLTTSRLAGGNQLLLEKTTTASASQALPPNPVACVAAAKFLQPTHPSQSATPSWSPHNRWFRILELLEVRPMDQETLLTQRPELWSEMLTRTPGRLQLNALPHGDNLFALLDDPRTFSVQTNGNSQQVLDLRETSRNWWFELLRTRDGVDPLLKQFTNGEPVILPGAPSSRPFRGLSHAPTQLQASANPPLLPETTEHGLLRRLGKDASANYNVAPDTITPTRLGQQAQAYRRLFEARSQADLAVGDIDLPSRNRLLAKVANNSTNRGHVFLVWMSVGFFDAVFPDPQNPAIVQVGAELEDQPRRRGFFVVDRSLLEEAYIPPGTGSNGQPSPGTFDFRKFVQYRRTMQ